VPALRPYLDEFWADPFANRHVDQLPSEGVFQEFPRLRVVLIESPVHLGYRPGFGARTKTGRGVRAEVPWIDRPPNGSRS
jgi:predicted TIM-barrel fold metal-dependent hydrolase